jgi:DSF synthase
MSCGMNKPPSKDVIVVRETTLLAEEVVGAILHRSGPLPQVKLTYEPRIKTLWVTIKPEPKPVFTLPLLTSVCKVQKAVFGLWGKRGEYDRSPVKFLAFRGEGPVFTLGGDLDFYLDCLALNDRQALDEYARVSVEGACWNASGLNGLVVTLSTIHAKAIGGGIDAPRSCNLMIAEEQASFAYPEVKFNHFPITAVAILSRRMGPMEAQQMLMSGDEYSAREFHERGGLDAVVASGAGEQWIRRYAEETLPMHAARTSLFAAFYQRAGRLEDELSHSAHLWSECMLRLAPDQISKLQRITRAQERMLSRMYRTESPADAASLDHASRTN